jgi:L-ascorbate metabolism protein UlaG (beta-lactamase superfamily)
MGKYAKLLVLITIFLLCGRLTFGGEINMLDNIKWLGHSSVLIERDGKNIYIDPWKLKTAGNTADILMITHSHHDHCSPEDINKIAGKDTVVIGPADALSKVPTGDKRTLLPGREIDLGWVKITGVPAYNPTKSFHPKANNWLGFIIKFPDASIYVAGDTDLIPEMKEVKADIVILPVGGTYTMDAQEAAEAVNLINPKAAIPIHFGDIVGSRADAERFASLVKSAQVKILVPEK